MSFAFLSRVIRTQFSRKAHFYEYNYAMKNPADRKKEMEIIIGYSVTGMGEAMITLRFERSKWVTNVFLNHPASNRQTRKL